MIKYIILSNKKTIQLKAHQNVNCCKDNIVSHGLAMKSHDEYNVKYRILSHCLRTGIQIVNHGFALKLHVAHVIKQLVTFKL